MRRRGTRGWSGIVGAAAFLAMLSAALCAVAAPLGVPITVDYLLLDAGLRQRFYTGPGGRAEFWRGASDCGHLYAMDPHFSSRDPKLRLESSADLQAALEMGGQCLNLLSWTGKIAADTIPRMEGWSLRFHVVDLEFLNPDGSTIGGGAFGAVKGPLLGQLENFSYNLEPDVYRLRMAAASTNPEISSVLKPVLDSMVLDSNVAIEQDGLKLSLLVTIPPNLTRPAALNATQRAMFAAGAVKLRDFLKTVGAQAQPLIVDPRLTTELDEILQAIETRLDAAAKAPPADGDPLPLVRDQWTRLRELALTAAHQGVFGPRTVEALETVMLTDAVFELDRQAPGLGSRLAAAGLNSLISRSNAAGAIARPS